MQPDQKGIYYIMGGPENVLRTSPLLEIYRKKESKSWSSPTRWMRSCSRGSKSIATSNSKAVNKTSAGEDLKDEKASDKSEELKPLLDRIKGVLGDAVKDVRASVRLADSPSCIVSDEDEPTMKMQQMLKAMGQTGFPPMKPVLEINPDHDIVKRLGAASDDALVNDASWLLLEQALLVEGVPVENPALFVQRLNRVLSRAV